MRSLFTSLILALALVGCSGDVIETSEVETKTAAPTVSDQVPVELRDDVAVSDADMVWMHKLARDHGCTIRVSLVEENAVDPGNARIDGGHIYLSKYMPQSEAHSMILHECAHMVQYEVLDMEQVDDLDLIYPPVEVPVPELPVAGWEGEDVPNPKVGTMVRVSGMEQSADCMAREWGATVFHYTDDCSGVRGEAAVDLINGEVPDTLTE